MSSNPDIYLLPSGADVIIAVRVQPRATRNALRMHNNGSLRITVTAPPVEDAANAAVCACLADYLGIGKQRISVCSGARSRNKRLKIKDIGVSEVMEKLAPILTKC